MLESSDRRTDLARRRRVDQLIARAQSARAEILEAGLAAVRRRPPSPHQVTAGGADARGQAAFSGR
jgi:hypothetical protein